MLRERVNEDTLLFLVNQRHTVMIELKWHCKLKEDYTSKRES